MADSSHPLPPRDLLERVEVPADQVRERSGFVVLAKRLEGSSTSRLFAHFSLAALWENVLASRCRIRAPCGFARRTMWKHIRATSLHAIRPKGMISMVGAFQRREP